MKEYKSYDLIILDIISWKARLGVGNLFSCSHRKDYYLKGFFEELNKSLWQQFDIIPFSIFRNRKGI